MPGADGKCIRSGQFDHGGVGAAPADEALAGCLGKGHAELDAGYRADQSFMEVLHRLDEMSLAEDEVDRLRLLDLDCDEFDFHSD